MSAQRLGAIKTRRLARVTELPVLRAWAFGGYVYEFITAAHEHGWFDLKTGGWGIYADPQHFSTCSTPERFAAEYHAADPE